jgi:hypothetical protein
MIIVPGVDAITPVGRFVTEIETLYDAAAFLFVN